MKKTTLILVYLTFMNNSFACLNEYRTLLSGEVVYTDPARGKVWTMEIDTIKLKTKAEKLINAYKRSDSIEYYSDYAATLTYLGKYQKAKKIYKEIEKISPNLYTTASNIGTIYELLGKPDSALIWIKRSIELNPKSHKGSEWIHIKILEYKLSKTRGINNSILELDFGDNSKPSNQNKYDLEELSDHIWHQLEERTVFVKPKNEIVGNIYFDLGNIFAQTRNIQTALESYEAAKEYGFESELMNKRIKEFEYLALNAKPYHFKEDGEVYIRDNFKFLFWSGLAIFIGFLALIIWLIRRKIKKRKGNTLLLFLLFFVLTSCRNQKNLKFESAEIIEIKVYQGHPETKISMKGGFEQDFIKYLNESEDVGPTKYFKKYKILILQNNGVIDTILSNGTIHQYKGWFKSKENLIEKYSSD